MFKMLKPRWLTVLTGVAVCTLMCAYTASDSWAAMCMVGYDTSACEGSGGTPKPACDPTKEKCGPTVNPPATCPNKGQTVTTDCQRLGYSERGAKPYPEDTWPKKALDKNGQPSSKWKCEPCTNGSGIVYDNSCYARYNCYASCQDENAATNVNGTNGPINGWGKNTTITSAISRKSRAYRDQFVRSQAECDILFGTKAGASGRMVSNYKFYWITKNICGSCEKRPCDGAEIVDGCYEICENKYTLEDGTQCCNKLDTLVSMNPAFGDADYWYPSTSPKYHHSGCYNTERQITAYGDFNNLGEENEGKYCYHQTPMTCADSCEEPKEDNGCACGPKSCETLATETGKPYSSSHSSITENSVIYSFSNGEVEKVNGICYQKTPVSNCPSTGCYTLSRLTCPNGEPDSDCGCGTGCPIAQNPLTGKSQQTIPESDYLAHSYYINGKVLKDASGNDKEFCLEVDTDGTTCTKWSFCYTYNVCSKTDDETFGLADFLTSDGAGGCMCNWPWKTEATDCDIGNAIDERLFSPPEGNIYKHDMTSTIDAIRCKKYDGVTCNGVLASGPDSNCQCQCTGDYTDYYLNSTYQGYSDWTANRISEDNYDNYCIVKGSEQTAYGYWTNKEGTTDLEVICYRYNTLECDTYSSNGVLVKKGCSCECGNGWVAKDLTPSTTGGWDGQGSMDDYDTYNSNVVNKDSQSGSYTDTAGQTQTITCYKYETEGCENGKVLTDEGCKSCSDYPDEQSSGDCGCAKKVVQTVEHQYQGTTVLTCYKCGNDDPQSCEDAGYFSNPATPTSPIEIGDNDWWCETQSAGVCVAWENGSAVSCYEGKTNNEAYVGLSRCTSIRGLYTTPCEGSEVAKNRCAYKCEEYHKCETNDSCPRYTSTTCPAGTTYVASTKKPCQSEEDGGNYETQKGYCQKGELFCDNTSSYANDTCLTAEERYEEYGE